MDITRWKNEGTDELCADCGGEIVLSGEGTETVAECPCSSTSVLAA